MADLLLWEHPLSPYVQKLKIGLREKGVAFTTRTPGGVGTGQVDPAFLAASPLAEVPALQHGDVALFESRVILAYLEEAFPRPPFMPADPPRAAKARMIETLCDTRYEAVNWAVAEITAFRRAEGEAAAALLSVAAREIAGLHAWLERQLGAGPYLCGEMFSWADAAALPHVAGAVAAGMGPPPDGALSDWLARASTRDSVAQTFAEARASAGGLNAARKAIAAGLFKRQYRGHRLEWMLRAGGAEIVTRGMADGTIRFSAAID
jgi:glutathione S-transferase/RNA polymerase-associated protein